MAMIFDDGDVQRLLGLWPGDPDPLVQPVLQGGRVVVDVNFKEIAQRINASIAEGLRALVATSSIELMNATEAVPVATIRDAIRDADLGFALTPRTPA